MTVSPGQTCNHEGVDVPTITLSDISAPASFALSLLEPSPIELPGTTNDGIAYLQPQRYATDPNGALVVDADGPYLGFTLVLDTLESSPFSDLNFDPEAGFGHWWISTDYSRSLFLAILR